MANNQRLNRIPDVCERLAISRSRVYELIRSEELKSVRIGTARRVTEEALEEFIKRLTDRFERTEP